VSAPIDMEQVTVQTIQGLGAEIAMLRFELNAQLAAKSALEARIKELEKTTMTED
jgi:hypothetical protein